ncbi:MAG: hypothetical protein ABIK86_02865 [candidate division WOR-3 bacterium]
MEGLVELLESLSGQAEKLAKRLRAYRPLLSDPVSNASLRAKAVEEIGRLAQVFPDSEAKNQVLDWLKEETAAVEKSREEFRFEFGRKLVAGLDGSGLAIRGQLPMLRIGFFTLRTDFDAGTATVFWGPEVEKLKSGLKLVPAELARTLRAYQDALREKSVEPARLAELMHSAYGRIVKFNNLPPGTRVFLLDLLAEITMLIQPPAFRLNPVQEKFVEYPRVRFSFDLFRLRQAGYFQVGDDRMKLHVANFDATTEKARALWVPDNEEGEGTHYSYVSFARGGPG